MPTTLILKSVPDAVYRRLKASAEANRRSLNSEAIVCLEVALLLTKPGPREHLARARELRNTLLPGKFHMRDIEAFKRQGRS